MNPASEKFTNVDFSRRLASVIAESGKTQREIALASGVSEGAMTNYLNGRFPRVEELKKIADELKVTPGWLLGWDKERRQALHRHFELAGSIADALGTSEDDKQELFNAFVTNITDLQAAMASAKEDIERGIRSLALLERQLRPASRPRIEGAGSEKNAETARESMAAAEEAAGVSSSGKTPLEQAIRQTVAELSARRPSHGLKPRAGVPSEQTGRPVRGVPPHSSHRQSLPVKHPKR